MRRSSFGLVALGALAATGSRGAAQQMGSVLWESEIASGTGGFTGALDARDRFGQALAGLGDLDGDGAPDLAVGVPDDDDGGDGRGALWLLFLAPDGTVRSQAKVSSTQGGFAGRLDGADRFGSAVARLGDLDGDGTLEVAVGAEQDDDGGQNRGAVWVLSLAPDGSVLRNAKISQTSGGFTGVLRNEDRFGHALARLADLDGDGVGELAVGALLDADGGAGRGAVWVLLLDASGAVKRHVKISSTSGGFLGALRDNDRFGSALAALGDLDRDGVPDLAAGAEFDDDGGSGSGATWILFLARDGSVRAQAKLSWASGLALDDLDLFGASLAAPGDIDGDEVPDLVVGAPQDDDGGPNRGALWVLFLAPDASLRGHLKISAASGGLSGPLTNSDFLGTSLAALGDLDGDRKLDLAAGAPGDDLGGLDRGALRLLFCESAVRASVTVRNGRGINPLVLTAEDAPAVGSTWEVQADCRGFRKGVLLHVVVDTRTEGPVLGRLGERLVDWSRPWLLRTLVRHRGEAMHFRHRVPSDPALVGLAFGSQALLTGHGGARLTNALDGEFLPPGTARAELREPPGARPGRGH